MFFNSFFCGSRRNTANKWHFVTSHYLYVQIYVRMCVCMHVCVSVFCSECGKSEAAFIVFVGDLNMPTG